ncbi:MAG: hypothetical protein IKO16_09165 [Lachnospiraceae bacterium]|nr:hypothetical protein [Lachnospiraceae bacterium]
MLDSDTSAELILADILNKEHSITGLTTSWIYSTEVRVLHLPWLYRPALLLFPNSWHLARTAAMCFAMILYAFANWLVFYAVKKPSLGLWAAAIALLPGGSWYFWYINYGAHYLPYILISLFSLSFVMMGTSTEKTSRRIVFGCLIALIGLLSGMEGIKQLMIFWSPLMLTIVIMITIELFGKSSDGKISGRSIRTLVLAAIGSGFAFIGYLINSNILSHIYKFKSYDNTVYMDGSFMYFVKQYIHSFGYAPYRGVVSFSGIAVMLGLIFGIVVTAVAALSLIKMKEVPEDYRFLTTFGSVSIFFLCFIFSITLGGTIEYLLPVVPFGYFLLIIWISNSSIILDNRRFMVLVLAWLTMLIISIGTIVNEDSNPFHPLVAHPKMDPIVRMLKDEGYTEGVSEFWTALLITDLSDGKIDMWTIDFDDDGDYGWYEFLQRAEHIGSFPKGRYFYLLEKNTDLEKRSRFLNDHPDLDMIYEDDKYLIYGN